MKKEEVIKWLTIMKANLNSFPEVSNAKKIEALAEAIRLLKEEIANDKNINGDLLRMSAIRWVLEDGNDD